MRKRFYRPTNQNLSGKKKILKIGPLGAEKTFMQKSNEKHLSGIGLMDRSMMFRVIFKHVPSNKQACSELLGT